MRKIFCKENDTLILHYPILHCFQKIACNKRPCRLPTHSQTEKTDLLYRFYFLYIFHRIYNHRKIQSFCNCLWQGDIPIIHQADIVFGSILLLFLQNRVLYNGFHCLDFDILRNHTFLVLYKTKVVFSMWGLDQCRNSKLARTSTCCQIYIFHPESSHLPFYNSWEL
jgi:hypothetical protein